MKKQKRQTNSLALLLCFIAIILSAFFYYDLPKPTPPPSAAASAKTDSTLTKVHFIDVGQGDSTLIESDGRYMLIDAGDNHESDTVIQYLNNLQVKRLDYVIGTHPHADHIGGLDKVIEAFEVGKVILPPKEHTTKTFEDLIDAIASKGMKITKPTAGDVYQLGSSTFQIIAPNGEYGDHLNNWSAGIRLTYGGTSFLFTGDAESEVEQDIVSNGLNIRADVLKLGHHGSRTSSSDEFLDNVKPTYAVISCSKDNSYGHPHTETMEKMKMRNIQVFRTDQQGTIVATTDGTAITWTTEDSNAAIYHRSF